MNDNPRTPAANFTRIAGLGDIHCRRNSVGKIRPHLRTVADNADLLLLAGDLTQLGLRDEGKILANELHDIGVPIIAVLGNHDFDRDEQDLIRADLEEAGVSVLEGENTVVEVHGRKIGIAGIKGFGGGFLGACGSEFGEPEMKSFIHHTRQAADRLRECLAGLDCDLKIALTHYAPIEDTLRGERLEVFPFLGSYLIGEAIDHGNCQLALHGHSHLGTESGMTSGGVPVRNVAQPVLRAPYRVYGFDHEHGELTVVAVASATSHGAVLAR